MPNLPNLITVVRVLLVPVFAYLLFRENFGWALAAFMAAAFSDFADGVIARHYRQLLQLKALQAQGVKPPEIARTLGIFEWKMTGMVSQANRQSFARLEHALERILQADESIKTGQLTDREAMDVLLVELMQA